jgi:hypothetical protein
MVSHLKDVNVSNGCSFAGLNLQRRQVIICDLIVARLVRRRAAPALLVIVCLSFRWMNSQLLAVPGTLIGSDY